MLSGLAQTGLLLANSKKGMSEIFFWLGVIVALAFFLGFAALWLRKKLLTQEEQVPMGFTLKDLRKLHELGQLSDEELAAAEEKALARSKSHYLGQTVAPIEEPEDIGHLSTGSEDDIEGGTENPNGLADKNPGDEPRP
jgi:hypothetical protein